jgi:Recombinase
MRNSTPRSFVSYSSDGYSMRGIATELDKRKVKTPRGGVWHPQLVKRIVESSARSGVFPVPIASPFFADYGSIPRARPRARGRGQEAVLRNRR